MAAPAFATPNTWPEEWTEQDLEMLPDDGHRYEILDGSLYVTPPAKLGHQWIEGNLYVVLRRAALPEWRVVTNIGVRVPGGNFVPDIAVVRAGLDPEADWHDPRAFGLVVEIASRSTEVNDRGNKVIKYAEAGIPAYWRVARDGTVTVHALVAEAQYGIIATVKPGTTWTATFPFEVTVDPDRLVADL